MTTRALHAPARLAGLPLLRTQTDERLVDLVRVGNDGAFEAMVARYRRPLLRYCSGLLPEDRAEDAVQQTFLRAYDALRASDSEMALRPWLYRIAHNVALNALRDRSLRFEELSEGIDGIERPDQAFEKNERLRDTVAAVGALPERQRDAMVLRELEGRSYDEIATALGVSDGAVRQLLNRARGTLRAGVTAVTPFGLLARVPWGSPGGADVGLRVAELCGAGAGGALVTKVCATALVTGAVVGGVASAPSGGTDEGRANQRGAEAAGERSDVVSPTPARRAGERDHRRGGRAEDSGSRRGGLRGDDDRSGPARSSGSDTDSSGPGSGVNDSRSGSSGSGGSGSDNSGPGSLNSGSVSSGSGSSGSGSGSSGSGSGSSGSGSGGSGSGSSGSGSGSSGSGSGSGTSGSQDLDASPLAD